MSFNLFSRNQGKTVIRDPENEKRHSVSIKTLEESFARKEILDEIGGNIIILVSNKGENRKQFNCPRCQKVNSVDESFLGSENTIELLICTNCDTVIPISS